jgi:preprotein translocase subunit SecA
VENIVVIPFTDGIRGMQVYANLKESVEHEGTPVVQTLEKSMTLAHDR